MEKSNLVNLLEPLTLEEVVDTFSNGLPDWQREENLRFITMIHRSLQEGGTWAHPDASRIWQKHGEGFILVGDVSP